MLFVASTMLGYFSYRELPVELYPNAQLPMLFVQVGSSVEVAPKYMESQAIIPLEGAIGTLQGVEEINSTAGQQQGQIRISFTQETNIKFAYLKLIEKIDAVKKDLPQEFFVQVFKFDMEQLNNMLMTVQVRGSGGVDRVRQIVDKEIVKQFENIDGIANAEVFGGREKSVQITLNEEVCKSHGITAADVRTALNRDSQPRTFAGKITNNNQLHFVNVISEFSDITEIQELEVIKGIKLKDISNVSFGVKEETSYSRVNGKDAITIQLTRDSQSNVIDLANTVLEQIEVLNKKFKRKDIEVVVQFNSAETMEENIDLIIELSLIGGILAIFVLWVFLKNFTLVTAIALAIPISIYTAFNFFYAYDVSINSLTLLGMSLAVGMLLDNSVVVLENIYRLAAKGVEPGKAVIQGTKEVWRSIFAATLTTITVFLPFAFADNFLIGLLGKHIGVSIISTLLVSLVVALLLVPMMTHYFLKHRKSDKPVNFEHISEHNRLVQIYMVLLKTSMRKPAKIIIGALVIFFATLLISLGISVLSLEEAEVTEMTLYVTMPGGTTLENTDALVSEVESKLENLEEKKDLVSQIYEEEAVLNISLKDDYKDLRNKSVAEIKNEILERVKDIQQAEFNWNPPATSGRFGSDEGGDFDDGGFGKILGIGIEEESVIIKGEDFDKMLNMASDFEYYLGQLATIQSIDVQVPGKKPELMIHFDKQLMSLYDIPPTAVLSELNTFKNEFSSGVMFKQGTEEFDILIKTITEKKEETKDMNDLKELQVRSNQGIQFELQKISKLNLTEGLPSIKRKNQEKQLKIVYRFIEEVSDDKELLDNARAEVDNVVGKVKMPIGMSVEIIHEETDLGEFGFLLFAAFILIYMILASVFESFTTPIVMMYSIPMAAIGSLFLLILTGNSIMNANVFTGFIILLGIVVNNGIILIDYSNVLQKRGYSESRALMMAGLARIRPILITAITTIIALVPLALGKAEYVTSIGVPFAITVIGGLTLSTLLTLVFIPTLNSGLQYSLEWMRKQKTYVKAIQIAIWLIFTYWVYTEIDSVIWQIIDFILIIIAVPAITFFIQNSLRKASETLISKDEPLVITIRNLVKIYERDSRFVREWKSGIKIRERLGLEQEIRSFKDFDRFVWQFPVIGFFFYFIYFHVEGGFWTFLLPLFFFVLVMSVLFPIMQFAISLKAEKKWTALIIKWLVNLFYWTYPAISLSLFYMKFELIGLVIPTGILWYLLLMIKTTSDNIYKNKTDINRITGRFKGIRKAFAHFVMLIPLIGKRNIPFKAVKGVSMTIENGMFGLLGPNGAGKSTLMKIICGILDPSYGQISINGINVEEKREELQALIGYLPQEFGMYENMTAYDFLHYMGILKKIYDEKERQERVKYVLEAVHMYDNRNEKIGSFSGGMKQRIGIAQILLHLPRILVVDEPTAGLDPRERIRFRNLLVELSKERIVIFSTHIIEDVASSCNRVAVMKKGYLKYLGEPIHMAGIAENKVWVMDVTVEEFERIKENFVIIHHIREGEIIRMRCLSDTKPAENAQLVKANLEDAYLSLLTSKD